MGPTDLAQVLRRLPQVHDPNLLVSVKTADDAGVYRIDKKRALVQTVDFFTPIVDDPYAFGSIAAANSFSDVYAMGGLPLTALNIVCFPDKKLDKSVLTRILKGGMDKAIEAGVAIVGGHTVTDKELKYGMAVTGIIEVDRVITNAGAKVGDKLILTKPLGTGLISTALKSGSASKRSLSEAIRSMSSLNEAGARAMQEIGVNACTDVTGFGLLGHAYGMASASRVGLHIFYDEVPLLHGAYEYAKKGFIAGGAFRNRDYMKGKVVFKNSIGHESQIVLSDPQTSGGLLISVPKNKAERLIDRLKRKKVLTACVIGEVIASPKGKVVVG